MPVFHYLGDDTFSRGEAYDALRAAHDPDGALATNTLVLDGPRTTLAEVTAAAMTVPFLAPFRLVRIDGLCARFETPRNAAPARKRRSTDGWDSFPVGVTPAESLVAESGTIVVGTGIAGRALSVLPPIHLVVATCDQLVGDLETSIRRIRTRYPDRLPSSFTWISGPSRTADIEKILVLGAHGPRRLVLLLLPAAASDHSTPA